MHGMPCSMLGIRQLSGGSLSSQSPRVFTPDLDEILVMTYVFVMNFFSLIPSSLERRSQTNRNDPLMKYQLRDEKVAQPSF